MKTGTIQDSHQYRDKPTKHKGLFAEGASIEDVDEPDGELEHVNSLLINIAQKSSL